ncbi:hypothetical protein SAMN04489743_2847 [Pseudarthrobacter equi]|uniref:Uncharacterized protein n=1 Tax=Pseudarthrobacter equi TaxID=728066 RepID=A0A1H2A8T9_9MICC|nr:hypothetical protein [Pseudarthrobacter equi]SDT42293.1 hypothetical protein SAMN04489743_2847 [Pseudarthrobacter equi]
MSENISTEATASAEAPENVAAPDVAPEHSDPVVEPLVLPEQVEGMSNMRRMKTIHIKDQKPLLVGLRHLAKRESEEKWDGFDTAANYAEFLRRYAVDKDDFDELCSGIDARVKIMFLAAAWMSELKK